MLAVRNAVEVDGLEFMIEKINCKFALFFQNFPIVLIALIFANKKISINTFFYLITPGKTSKTINLTWRSLTA